MSHVTVLVLQQKPLNITLQTAEAQAAS